MMPSPNLNAEEIALCERLRSLKLSGMADALETQLMDPNADLVPFTERFSTIVNQEWQIRYNKKFSKFMKKAQLRYPDAALDETIYDPARKLDTASIERLATDQKAGGSNPSRRTKSPRNRLISRTFAFHKLSFSDTTFFRPKR